MKKYATILMLFSLSLIYAEWTSVNSLETAEDLQDEKISNWNTILSDGASNPGPLPALVDDPLGVLDGKVLEITPGGIDNARYVIVHFPEPTPTSSEWTFYYRWMIPQGGAASLQSLEGNPVNPNTGRLADENDFTGTSYGRNPKLSNFWAATKGIYYHHWAGDRAFATNPAASGWIYWRDENQANILFDFGTWYETWLVVDPSTLTFSAYVRGGAWTEITPVFVDEFWSGIEKTDGFHHWQMGIYGETRWALVGYAPVYFDAFYLDYSGNNLSVPDGQSVFAGGTWGGWPIAASGAVDTESFLGWVNVTYAPYVWVYSISSWVYMQEPSTDASGSWAYIWK